MLTTIEISGLINPFNMESLNRGSTKHGFIAKNLKLYNCQKSKLIISRKKMIVHMHFLKSIYKKKLKSPLEARLKMNPIE